MIERFDATSDLVAIGDAIDTDGVVIVEGLLSPEVVERVNAEVEAAVAVADPGEPMFNPVMEAFHGPCTKQVPGVPGISRSFAIDVMCHPLLLALCDRFLAPSCARYQLNLGHLLQRGPGAEDQWLHRDEAVWSDVPRPAPELQLASVIAFVDFTRANGATRVVPGSHQWPRERQPEPDEVLDAVLPVGGAVIYLGSTIHYAGTNSTDDEWRLGVHVSFTLGWLRTEENNLLAVPPSVARALSPAAQELLGYAVHDAIADGGGYLGMVRMRDPMELLAEGELT